MSEATRKTCQFKSKLDPDYKCPEPPLEESEKGYCVFHEPKKDKDIEKFNEGIKHKLKQKDYNFLGYWFPGGFLPVESIVMDATACFVDCIFKGNVYFKGAIFAGWADFVGTVFEGEVDFRGATFRSGANFVGTTFMKFVDFMGSIFRPGTAPEPDSFWPEELGRVIPIGEHAAAYFTLSIFKEFANFQATIFEGNVSFAFAAFENDMNFAEATFKKAIVLQGLETKSCHPAEELFRKAKIGWHRQGNYVEEGEAHYQEMDCIRRQKKWYVRYIWTNLFHRLLHGYGEKPHRVILWAVAIVIACALLFMNFGIGETRLFVENLPTYNIFKILFKLHNLSWADLGNIGRYFYFSVVTFTTLGYGDLRPVHPISHLISSIEAFTGMFMMALFVLTFGRKWRR